MPVTIPPVRFMRSDVLAAARTRPWEKVTTRPAVPEDSGAAGFVRADGQAVPNARSVAEVLVTDGAYRPVREEPDRRQYVLDGREKVYGLWILPDEPVEVQGALPA